MSTNVLPSTMADHDAMSDELPLDDDGSPQPVVGNTKARFRKWSRFLAIGALLVVALGIGLGVGLSNSNPGETPPGPSPNATQPPMTLPPEEESFSLPELVPVEMMSFGEEKAYFMSFVAVDSVGVGTALQHGIRVRDMYNFYPFNMTQSVVSLEPEVNSIEYRMDFKLSGDSLTKEGVPEGDIVFDYGWFLPGVPEDIDQDPCIQKFIFGNDTGALAEFDVTEAVLCEGVCNQMYDADQGCIRLGRHNLHNFTVNFAAEDTCSKFPADDDSRMHAKSLCTKRSAVETFPELMEVVAEYYTDTPTTGNARDYTTLEFVFPRHEQEDTEEYDEEDAWTFESNSTTDYNAPTVSPTSSPTAHVIDFESNTIVVPEGVTIRIINEREVKRLHSFDADTPLFEVKQGGQLMIENVQFANMGLVVNAVAPKSISFEDCEFDDLQNGIVQSEQGGKVAIRSSTFTQCNDPLRVTGNADIELVGVKVDNVTTITNCADCKMEMTMAQFSQESQSPQITNDGTLTVRALHIKSKNPSEIFAKTSPVIADAVPRFVGEMNSSLCQLTNHTAEDALDGFQVVEASTITDCQNKCGENGNGECYAIWYDFLSKGCVVCSLEEAETCRFPCMAEERNTATVQRPKLYLSYVGVPENICETESTIVESEAVVVKSIYECQALCSYQKECRAIDYNMETRECTYIYGSPILQLSDSSCASSRNLHIPLTQKVEYDMNMVLIKAPNSVPMCFVSTENDDVVELKDTPEQICVTVCKHDPSCLGMEFRESMSPKRSIPGVSKGVPVGTCRFFSTRALDVDESGTSCMYIDDENHAGESSLYIVTTDVFPQRSFLKVDYCAPHQDVLDELNEDAMQEDVHTLEQCKQLCDLGECSVMYYDVLATTCYLFRDALWNKCAATGTEQPVYIAYSVREVIPSSELVDEDEELSKTGPVTVASGPASDLITLEQVTSVDSCTTLCDSTEGCYAFSFNMTLSTCTLSSVPDFADEDQLVFRENFDVAGTYVNVTSKCISYTEAEQVSTPGGITSLQCAALCERSPTCTGFILDGSCTMLNSVLTHSCDANDTPTPFAISPSNQYRDAFISLPDDICLLPGTEEIEISALAQDEIVVRDMCQETCFDSGKCRVFSFQDGMCRGFVQAELVSCSSLNQQDQTMYSGLYLEVLSSFYRAEEEYIPGSDEVETILSVETAQACTAVCDIFTECISVMYHETLNTCTLLSGTGISLPDSQNAKVNVSDILMLVATPSYPITELQSNTASRAIFCGGADDTRFDLLTLGETSMDSCEAVCDAHLECKGFKYKAATTVGQEDSCTLVTSLSICTEDSTSPEIGTRYFVNFRDYLNSDQQPWDLGLRHESGICLLPANPIGMSSGGESDSLSVNATSMWQCVRLCQTYNCKGFAFDEEEYTCTVYGEGTQIDREGCPSSSTVREVFMYTQYDYTQQKGMSMVDSDPVFMFPHKTKEECAMLCQSKYDCEAYMVNNVRQQLLPGQMLIAGIPLLPATTAGSSSTSKQQYARMEKNGNFVVYNMEGGTLSVLWSSTGTAFRGTTVLLTLEGHLQVIDADHNVLYEKVNDSGVANVALEVDRFGLLLRNLGNGIILWRLSDSTTPDSTELNEYGQSCEDFRSGGICCGSGPCFGQSWNEENVDGPPDDCLACQGDEPGRYVLKANVCFQDDSPLKNKITEIDTFNKIGRCQSACDNTEGCVAFQYNRMEGWCTLHNRGPPSIGRKCDGVFEKTDTYYASGITVEDDLTEMPEMLTIGDRLISKATKANSLPTEMTFYSMLAGDGKWVIVDTETNQRWWQSIDHAPATKILFDRSENQELQLVDSSNRVVWEVSLTIEFEELQLTFESGSLNLSGTMISQEATETTEEVREETSLWGARPVDEVESDDTALVGECSLFESSTKLVANKFATTFTYGSPSENFVRLENRCISSPPMSIPEAALENMPLEACKHLCTLVSGCKAVEHDGGRGCKLYNTADFFCDASEETGVDRRTIYLEYSFLFDDAEVKWIETIISSKGAFKLHPMLEKARLDEAKKKTESTQDEEESGESEGEVPSNATSILVTDSDRKQLSTCRAICERVEDCYGFEWHTTSTWNSVMWKRNPPGECRFITKEFDVNVPVTVTNVMAKVEDRTMFYKHEKPICMSDEDNLDTFEGLTLNECMAVAIAHPFAVAFEHGLKSNPKTQGKCVLKSKLPSEVTDECAPKHPFSYKKNDFTVYTDSRAFYTDVPAFNLPRATAMAMPKVFPEQVLSGFHTYETCAETCYGLPREVCAMFLFTGGVKGANSGYNATLFQPTRIMNDDSFLCLDATQGENEEVLTTMCSPDDAQHLVELPGNRLGIWGTNVCLEADDDVVRARKCDASNENQQWDSTSLQEGTSLKLKGKCVAVTSSISWTHQSSMIDLMRGYQSEIPDVEENKSRIKLVPCDTNDPKQKWQWISGNVIMQDRKLTSASLPFAELIWGTMGAVRAERVSFVYHFRTNTIGIGGVYLYGNCLEITDADFLRVEPWNKCDLSGETKTQLWNYDEQRNKVSSMLYENKCLQGKPFLVPRGEEMCPASGNERRLAIGTPYQPPNKIYDGLEEARPMEYLSKMFSYLFVSRPMSLEMDDCDDENTAQTFFPDNACILYGATLTEPSPVENLGNQGQCMHIDPESNDKTVRLESCDSKETSVWSYDILHEQLVYAGPGNGNTQPSTNDITTQQEDGEVDAEELREDEKYAHGNRTCLSLDVNFYDTVDDDAKDVPVRYIHCMPKKGSNSSGILQWLLPSSPRNGAFHVSQGTVLESPLQYEKQDKMFRLAPDSKGKIHSYAAQPDSTPSLKEQWRAFSVPEVRTSPFKFVSRRSVSIRPYDKFAVLADPEVQFHLWFFSSEAILAKKLLQRAESFSERATSVTMKLGSILSTVSKGTNLVATFSSLIEKMDPKMIQMDVMVDGYVEVLRAKSTIPWLGRMFAMFKTMLSVGWTVLKVTFKGLKKALSFLTKIGAVLTIIGSILSALAASTIAPAAGIEALSEILVRVSKCSHDLDRESSEGDEDISAKVDVVIRNMLGSATTLDSVISTLEDIANPLYEIRLKIDKAFGPIQWIMDVLNIIWTGLSTFDFFFVFLSFGVDIPVMGKLTVGHLLQAIGWMIRAVAIIFFGAPEPVVALFIEVLLILIEQFVDLPSLLPDSFGSLDLSIFEEVGDTLEKKASEIMDSLLAAITDSVLGLPSELDLSQCYLGPKFDGIFPKVIDEQKAMMEGLDAQKEEEAEEEEAQNEVNGGARRLEEFEETPTSQEESYETLHPHTHMYEHGVVRKYNYGEETDKELQTPIHRDELRQGRRKLVQVSGALAAALPYRQISNPAKKVLRSTVITMIGNAMAPDDDDRKKNDDRNTQRKSKTSRRRSAATKGISKKVGGLFGILKKHPKLNAALSTLLNARSKKKGGDGVPSIQKQVVLYERSRGTKKRAGVSLTYLQLEIADKQSKKFAKDSKAKTTPSSTSKTEFREDEAHLVYTFLETHEGSTRTESPPICVLPLHKYRGIPKVKPTLYFDKEGIIGGKARKRFGLRNSFDLELEVQSALEARGDRPGYVEGSSTHIAVHVYRAGQLASLERRKLVKKKRNPSRKGVNRCLNGAIQVEPKLKSTTVRGTNCKFVVDKLKKSNTIWRLHDLNCVVKQKKFNSLEMLSALTDKHQERNLQAGGGSNLDDFLLSLLEEEEEEEEERTVRHEKFTEHFGFTVFFMRTQLSFGVNTKEKFDRSKSRRMFYLKDTHGALFPPFVQYSTEYFGDLKYDRYMQELSPQRNFRDYLDYEDAAKEFRKLVNFRAMNVPGNSCEKEEICSKEKYVIMEAEDEIASNDELQSSASDPMFPDPTLVMMPWGQQHFCYWDDGKDEVVCETEYEIGEAEETSTEHKSSIVPLDKLFSPGIGPHDDPDYFNEEFFSVPQIQLMDTIIDSDMLLFNEDEEEDDDQYDARFCTNIVSNSILASDVWVHELSYVSSWENAFYEKVYVYGLTTVTRALIGVMHSCYGTKLEDILDFIGFRTERNILENPGEFLDACSSYLVWWDMVPHRSTVKTLQKVALSSLCQKLYEIYQDLENNLLDGMKWYGQKGRLDKKWMDLREGARHLETKKKKSLSVTKYLMKLITRKKNSKKHGTVSVPKIKDFISVSTFNFLCHELEVRQSNSRFAYCRKSNRKTYYTAPWKPFQHILKESSIPVSQHLFHGSWVKSPPKKEVLVRVAPWSPADTNSLISPSFVYESLRRPEAKVKMIFEEATEYWKTVSGKDEQYSIDSMVWCVCNLHQSLLCEKAFVVKGSQSEMISAFVSNIQNVAIYGMTMENPGTGREMCRHLETHYSESPFG